MNVLKQQSYAEALGMTKEMVDEIFKKQELANALGAQAGADLQTQYKILRDKGNTHQQIVGLMGQQAASDALSASASERMQATMERVNDTIGKMAQAFMPVIEKVAALAEKFASFVGSGDNLRNILIGVSAVLGGMLTTSIALGAQKKAMLVTDRAIALENVRQQTINNGLLANQQLQALSQKQQFVTSRGITLTKVAQNTATTTGIALDQAQTVAARGKQAIEASIAASKIAGGSSYLGPLAFAVGAAAFAGLMALATSGGGASSAPSIPMTPAMSPMNSNVANAAAVEKASGPNRLSTGGIATDKSVNVIMNVDGVQFAKATTKSLANSSTVATTDKNQYNQGP
jgi:hypothetical protein